MSWLRIKKIIILKCHLLLFLTATMNHFLIGLWCGIKWIFYDNQWITTSAARQRRSSKAFSEVKLTWKKGHGHCLVVCCPCDLQLQLSEYWQNHYICEVRSANWCNEPKTVRPAASTGQKNGPNSSPYLITRQTTNASKVEQLGYKILLIHRIHLISGQLITTSLSTSTSCRENASTTSRR